MTDLHGDQARGLRIELIKDQRAVQHDGELAEALDKAGEVVSIPPDEKFIYQGSYDDDLYFILRGSVVVETNGHRHAFRDHKCHVGEMSLLDPGSGRSANVFADSKGAVLLKVDGDCIRKIGAEFPSLWFGFARELAERLRGRDSSFIQPNEKPAIFIASSGAAAADLQRVAKGLETPDRDVRPWTGPNIFNPSDFTINSLLAQAHTVDFAVIIATPDDLVVKNAKITKNKKATMSARDNVLLEYGLFAGALDRDRVFILQKASVNLASDLQGLTCLRYENDDELDLKIAEIAHRVDYLGPIKRLLRRKDT